MYGLQHKGNTQSNITNALETGLDLLLQWKQILQPQDFDCLETMDGVWYTKVIGDGTVQYSIL